MQIDRECMFCQQKYQMDVDEKAYAEWYMGFATIQEAFSCLSAGEREQILSGIHDHCWDKNIEDR